MFVADASQVSELAAWTGDWAVSTFLPVHSVLGKQGGDSLRLKNLLRDAENELVQVGMRRSDAACLLGGAVPAEVNDPGSAAFHRAGIAAFAAAGVQRTYQVAHDAPSQAIVARRFHLKPLLRELEDRRQFFVLAVTRGSARLHVGGPKGLRPVKLPGMPASLGDAIQYDDRERALLSHSASRRGVGGVVAAFHGQGDRGDHISEDVLRYLRMVDASLKGVVGDTTPLVLAGSRDVVAAYRELSARGALAGEGIFGNPEQLTPTELHARARKIVDDADSTAADDAATFARFHGTGKASDALATVVAAARRGRVATLFVASDAQCWGRFDSGADEPELHGAREPGDEDLLDTAAVDAWKTGATVRVTPAAAVPGGSPIAAVFRY